MIEQSASRLTVLVVDDDPLMLRMLCVVLRRSGYEVVDAACAAEALRIAEDGVQFQLVVTDLMMPGMSGVDLWHRLKSLRPAVPVLLISGGSPTDLETHVVPLELPFLPKPFKPDEIVQAIERLIGAPSERR